MPRKIVAMPQACIKISRKRRFRPVLMSIPSPLPASTASTFTNVPRPFMTAPSGGGEPVQHGARGRHLTAVGAPQGELAGEGQTHGHALFSVMHGAFLQALAAHVKVFGAGGGSQRGQVAAAYPAAHQNVHRAGLPHQFRQQVRALGGAAAACPLVRMLETPSALPPEARQRGRGIHQKARCSVTGRPRAAAIRRSIRGSSSSPSGVSTPSTRPSAPAAAKRRGIGQKDLEFQPGVTKSRRSRGRSSTLTGILTRRFTSLEQAMARRGAAHQEVGAQLQAVGAVLGGGQGGFGRIDTAFQQKMGQGSFLPLMFCL